jgi:hypothetical protein
MLQRNLTVIVAVVVAVSTSVLAGCDEQVYMKGEGTELARVTSPNGQLDAVLMRYMYGGAVGGGVDSNVYIVRKGAPVGTAVRCGPQDCADDLRYRTD